MNVGQRGINLKDLGGGRLILIFSHVVALIFGEVLILKRREDLRKAAIIFFFSEMSMSQCIIT